MPATGALAWHVAVDFMESVYELAKAVMHALSLRCRRLRLSGSTPYAKSDVLMRMLKPATHQI
jgi:hypothetical protein